jgi:hypothetical protein
MCDYERRVRTTMDGIRYFSTGPAAGCMECDLSEDATDDELNGANEPSFSWSACERCNSTFGGDRYPAHGFYMDAAGQEHLLHYSVCADCVMHDANGEEPEDWHEGPYTQTCD